MGLTFQNLTSCNVLYLKDDLFIFTSSNILGLLGGGGRGKKINLDQQKEKSI